ncbi:MAG: hypothetical protein ACPIOQ_57965, partial [Promethearchaeia archaeon]
KDLAVLVVLPKRRHDGSQRVGSLCIDDNQAMAARLVDLHGDVILGGIRRVSRDILVAAAFAEGIVNVALLDTTLGETL